MKIFIAIPAYDRKVDVGVLRGVCGLLADSDHEFIVSYAQGSIISDVRNVLVEQFLKTDAEFLLFWDADIEVLESDFLARMLECWLTRGGSNSEPIVALPCRVKGNDELNCGFVVDGAVKRTKHAYQRGEVHVAGCGVMLIPRPVFEKVDAPWFEVLHNENGTLGEDFNFCLKAREKGFWIGVEPASTAHYGTAAWIYGRPKATTV